MPIAEIVIGSRIRQELGDLQSLKKSIERVGLLHPVVVTPDSRLVSGERRLEAVKELGWTEVPTTVAHNIEDAVRWQAEGDENVCREGFAPVEAEQLWQRWVGYYAPPNAERTGGRPRKGQETGENFSPVSRDDTKTRSQAAKPTGMSFATLKKVETVREVAEEHPDPVIRALAAAVLDGPLSKRGAKVERHYNEIMKAVKKAAAEIAIAAAAEQPSDLRVEHCSITDLDVPPDSVDLIFTDPPYPEEHLHLWSDLGAFAAKTLKPGNLLLAYTGQLFLPQVMGMLGEHLEYWWCGAITHTGAFFQLKSRHIQVGWKPVLMYRKPGPLPPWCKDIVTEGGREKTEHLQGGEWQQSEIEAAYWISTLTDPGALIADPFVGSGTTIAACKAGARRFIGCDTDPAAVKQSRERACDG